MKWGTQTRVWNCSRSKSRMHKSPHLFVTYIEKGVCDVKVSKYRIKFGGTKKLRRRNCTAYQQCEWSRNSRTGMNLGLNVKKKKLLVAGADPDQVHNIEIDGETVEQVDHFKYLGSTKYSNANCSKEHSIQDSYCQEQNDRSAGAL